MLLYYDYEAVSIKSLSKHNLPFKPYWMEILPIGCYSLTLIIDAMMQLPPIFLGYHVHLALSLGYEFLKSLKSVKYGV